MPEDSHGASNLHLPSFGSLGTNLGRPRRASEQHHMTLPRHECAFKGPPMALGGTPWITLKDSFKKKLQKSIVVLMVR